MSPRAVSPAASHLRDEAGIDPGGRAHQNGDVESATIIWFRRWIRPDAAREFGSVEDYEEFVAGILRSGANDRSGPTTRKGAPRTLWQCLPLRLRLAAPYRALGLPYKVSIATTVTAVRGNKETQTRHTNRRAANSAIRFLHRKNDALTAISHAVWIAENFKDFICRRWDNQ